MQLLVYKYIDNTYSISSLNVTTGLQEWPKSHTWLKETHRNWLTGCLTRLYQPLCKVWRYEKSIQISGGKLKSKYPPGRPTECGPQFVMVTDLWNWLRIISSGKLYYYNCIEDLYLVPISWITTNMDCTKICCGDRRVDLAQDDIRWQILVLAVLNLRFLLPECAVVIWSTCSEERSRWKIGQWTDQLRR